jgi:hypothetical protein
MTPRFFRQFRFLLLCLSAAVWIWTASAAMKPVIVPMNIPPAPDGERFLFILDVSSGMENLQAGNETALYELISTGVGGYMRAGDTYGIWTFNKETYTDKLSMQVWDPKRSKQLATIAAAAVNNQNYEKSCNMKQLMQRLTSVIHAVSNVTFFVLTDGDTDMVGTPFDKTINAEYRKQNRLRRQVKRPFVATLVVRDGWFVESKVRVAGQAIELPERPPSLLLAQTNATMTATSSLASAKIAMSAPLREPALSLSNGPPGAPAAATDPPKRKVVQIITKPNTNTLPPAPSTTPVEPGKTELASAPASAPAAATTNTLITSTITTTPTTQSVATGAPVLSVVTNTNITNVIATVSAGAPPKHPVDEIKAGPSASAPAVAASSGAPTSAPTSASAAASPPPAAPAIAIANTVPTQNTVTAPNAPAGSTLLTAPPTIPPAPTATAPAHVSAIPVTPSAASPATQPPAAVPVSGLLQKLAPGSAPLVVAARERATISVSPPVAANAPAAVPPATPSAAPGSSAVQGITPGPALSSSQGPSSFVSMGWMLAFGASLLALASMLLVLVSRRGRSHDSGSLITQSMERR